MTGRDYQITAYVHRMVKEHILPGDICIDATMGNGLDTLFLCRQVQEQGQVIAFDIQEEALTHTRKYLEDTLSYKNYQLHRKSHVDMAAYAEPGSVSCILFNLGYLPGGDHSLSTKADTTKSAIEAGLTLLKKGGILGICIYSGGDSGYEEKNAVLSYIKELDPKKYLVLITQYYNRPNDPPIPAFVIKL